MPDCPTVSPVTSVTGNIGNMVSWTIGACTDAEDGSITPVCNPMSGSFFDVGENPVTCTCTDSGDLSTECSFNAVVNQVDPQLTVVDCPQSSVTETVPFGSRSTTVFWQEPSATSNTGGVVTVTQSHNPEDQFFIGETTVIYTFTDSLSELRETCTFLVIVQIEANTDPPMPVCPTVSPVLSFTGNIGNFVSWTIGDCNDDEDGSITPVCNPISGSFFNVGSTPVTCTCTDSGSRSSQCTFNAVVIGANTDPPMPVCPNVSPVLSFTGNIGNFVSWTIGDCNDDEDGSITPVCNPMSGSFFNVGSTPVTCTCTDSGSLSSQCTFNASVLGENSPPSMPVCPTVSPVTTFSGNIGNFVSWTIGACTDVEDVSITPVCNPMSGSFFNVGSTPVTCTCTDLGSLSSQCTFNASVLGENSPPSMPDCPTVSPVTTFSGNIGNFVSWTIGACTDVEDVSITPVCNPMSGSFFNVGSTPVTCTCTDLGSLSSQCTFNASVLGENSLPSMPVCPTVSPVTTFSGNIGNFVSWTIGACTDVEDVSITPVCNPMSGSFFNVGSTPVTCTCTDLGSLSSQCTFNASVLGENSPPSMPVCPTVSPVTSFSGNIGNFVSWTIGACTDVEDVSITPVCNPMSGSFFSVGSTPVTCTCTDSGSLSSQCTFNASVLGAIVNNPPVFVDCSSSVQTISVSQTQSVYIYTDPTCTDPDGDQVTVSCNPSPGIVTPITSQIQCTCSDTSGATDTSCTLPTIENNPPVFVDCSSSVQIISVSQTQSVYIYTDPTCTDPDGDQVTVSCNPSPGIVTPITSQIQCTCSDTSGATDTSCTLPTIENNPPMFVDCSSSVQTISVSQTQSVYIYTDPTCTDPDGDQVTVSCNPSPGIVTPITSQIQCTCSDTSGATDTSCTLPTNSPPNLTCPMVERVTSLSGDIGNFVSWDMAACIDSEDGSITPICSQDSGSFFSVGSSTVTCTCTDLGGLSTDCSFDVDVSPVIDTTPPAIDCPGDISFVADIGAGGAVVSIVEPTATDNSGSAFLVSRSVASPSFFPIGKTTVAYIFGDEAGNLATCSFCITVEAELMCTDVPSDIEMFVGPGVQGTLVTWQEPSCSSPFAALTCSESSPQFFVTGTTTAVVCTCDAGAMSAQCAFTVSVMTSGPVALQVMNCPSNPIQVIPTSGSTTIPVVWTEPFALTNSGSRANVLSQTHRPGDSFNIPSVTQVTYVFEASGATEMCTFEVRVAQPAVVAIDQPCPNDFTTFADPGVQSIPISWNPPTAVNENGVAVPVTSQSHLPGAQFSVPSTTTVTYVFNDRAASATCSFRITASTRIVPPTIINCPNDIQTTASSGAEVVGVTWEAITVVTPTGQLAIVTSASHMSGDLFEIGKTAVIIVFSDPSAPQSTATCQFQVCVSTPPDPPTLISCPSDITQRANTMSTLVPVFWTPPTAVTAAGGFAVVTMQTQQSGDGFQVGITPVSITFTDPAPFGQSVTCTFQVIVLPPLAPPTLLNCPEDITLTSTSGSGVTVSYQEPTAITQSGQLATVISQSNFPGDLFPVGKTTVRYTFADPAQPTSTRTECVFCITIELVLPNPPVITSCPGLITTISATGGSVTVSWDVPTAVSGGQPSRLSSQTHFPGSLFPVGVTNVQYVFSDPNNEAVTSTCDITVEVLGPPILVTCPGDFTEVSLSGDGVFIAWNPPSAVTSQGMLATIQGQTHFSGTVFPVGITCVEITFFDPASGLTVVCKFRVTVLGPPDVTGCPADQAVTSVQSTVPVTWVPPTAVSTLGIPLAPIATHNPGSLFQSPSTTMVMYTFTDPDSALTGQCVFIVTVIRPEPPVLVNCPVDIMMSAPSGPNVPVTFSVPSAVSSGSLVPCITSQQVTPTFPVPSMTTFVYTCTNVEGLSVTCTFDVVITEEFSPPTVSGCPEDIMLEGPRGIDGVPITWIEPTAVTSSGVPAEVSSSFSPGDTFPVPSNFAVSYLFTDPVSGLQDNSCSFFIVIDSPPPIIEPPTVLGCPADVEFDADNSDSVSVSWAEPSAISNTPGSSVTTTSNRESGSTFSVPSTEVVVYTFTDSSNPSLSSECTFTVTVTGDDTIPPTIENCPGNILLTTMVNTPLLAVSWIEPTATDQGLPVNGMSNFSPGDEFPTGTSTGILYRFTDAAGNTNQCTFTVSVTVLDIEPPVVSNCPEVISITAVNDDPQALSWIEPTAVDNFGTVTVTQTHMPGDTFAVDTSTLVTYTFTDESGNRDVCIFAVSVTSAPDDPPNIVFCPPNVGEMASAGAQTLSVLWQEPQAQDDSGEPVGVIASHMPGDLFVVDVTTSVIYTFTDNAGQVAVCTFTVTVTAPADVNPPSITNCPMPVFFERVATGSSIAVVDWEEPVATDQESVVTVEQSHTPPLSLPVGAGVLVTYTFFDRSGNSARCTFTIFVLPADSSPPVFMNCPNDIRVPARVTDVGTSAVGWLEPVAMDVDSEPVVVSVNFGPGTEFPIGGPITVVYLATDSAVVPNTAECTFIVEVLPFDNVDPVIINCPSPNPLSILPSFDSVPVTWIPPMTVDVATFTSNFQPGDSFPADTTTEVIYTLTDSSGNTATCDFTVTVVRDGDPPGLIMPCPRLDIEMSFTVGITEVAIETLWVPPVATEPFLNVITTVVVNPDYPNFANGFLPVDGVRREVRYSFRDSLGNAQDCVFFVTLSEDTGPGPAPVFATCPPSPLFTLTARTGATASRTWPVVEAADPNGGPFTLTSSPLNVDSFPVGSTTVMITATNEGGISSVCTFFVLVSADDIAPVANCPPQVTEVLPMGDTTVVVTWNVDITDNSGSVTVMQEGPRSGDSFGEGTSQVTYTATDEAGNIDMCIVNIIVTPIGPEQPAVTVCPTTFTAYTNDPSPQMVMLPQTEAEDANGITLIGVLTSPTVNLFTPSNPPQPQTVTFTFTDGAGETNSCPIELSFILDQTSPTFINCPPGTVSGTLSVGMANVAVPVVQMISALDDSNIDPTVTTDPTDITMFPFGMTEVTFTATDVAGNSAQCNFIVDINAMPCDPNPCPFPLTEVCTPSTNTFTCAADVDPPIIFGCPDAMMPVMATPGPMPGENTVVVTSLPVVTATDNLDTNLEVVSTVPDGNIFPSGTTSVTITFTDDASNEATCTYNVVVDDVLPPVIDCPPNQVIRVDLPAGENTIVVPELTVTDNVDANPGVIRVPDGNTFQAGITAVSVTATDMSGNLDTCAYNVEVSSPCDTVLCLPPSVCVNGPGGATCGVSCNREGLECNSGSNFCIEIVPGLGTCTGDTPECLANCPSPTATMSCQAGRCIGNPVDRTDCPQGCLVGETCVTGNCVVDSVSPTVTCPSEAVTGSIPGNQQVTTVVLPDIPVNDNLDVNPVVLISPVENSFSAGTTIVTVTALDDAGNMDECTFNVEVTVNPCNFNPCENGGTCTPDGTAFLCLCEAGFGGDMCQTDILPPVIENCPPNQVIRVDLAAGQDTIMVPELTVTDNVDPNPGVVRVPDGNTFQAGITAVSVTATDMSGNLATCAYNVEVSSPCDTVLCLPPSVCVNGPSGATCGVSCNREGLECNSGSNFCVEIQPGLGTCTGVTPECLANCPSPTATMSCQAGRCIGNPVDRTDCPQGCLVGETCVTGNCVVDTVDPTVTCPSEAVTGSIPANQQVTTVVLPEFLVNDNLDVNPVVLISPADNIFSAGTTIVTVTALDDAGNMAECTFNVEVPADVLPPVIENCPPNQVIRVDLAAGQDTIMVPELTVTDNVDPNPGVIRVPDGNTFQAGITAVSVTATDLSGNLATCAYNVEVSSPCDTVLCIPPSVCVNGPGGATCGVSCNREGLECNSGSNFCIETQPGLGTCTGDTPECLANCPSPTATMSCQAGRCIGNPVDRTDCPQGCLVGETCVTGNCVVDTVDPTVTCPSEAVTGSIPTNQQVTTVVLPEFPVNDNLDVNPVVLISPADNIFSAGTTIVTVTALDDAGNMAECTFNVEVTTGHPCQAIPSPCDPNECFPLPDNQFQCGGGTGRKKRAATDFDGDDDGHLMFEGMNLSDVEKLNKEDGQYQEQPIVREENISISCSYYLPTLLVVALLIISFTLTCRRGSRNKLVNGEV